MGSHIRELQIIFENRPLKSTATFGPILLAQIIRHETTNLLYESNVTLTNSRGPQQKTYLSFGTDLAHVIDLTESLIIGNENIAQNVELEWKIFYYQRTVLYIRLERFTR